MRISPTSPKLSPEDLKSADFVATTQSDSLWTVVVVAMVISVVVVKYEGIKSVPFHFDGRKQEDL